MIVLLTLNCDSLYHLYRPHTKTLHFVCYFKPREIIPFNAFVKEKPWIETTIFSFLGRCSAKDINSPFFIKISYVFSVRKNSPTHLISITSILISRLQFFFFAPSHIAEKGSVWSNPLMPYNLLVWCIELVSRLPGRVGLIRLFPVKYITKWL